MLKCQRVGYTIMINNIEMEKTIRLETVLICDLLMVVLLYMIPTISHFTTLPLYQFEPMRCALLLTLILTGSKKNTYIMAATLPLFSFVVGSHPVFVKAILMSIELVVNVFLFDYLLKLIKNNAVSMFIAIMLSKAFYYILKYLCITTGLLEISMFSTSLLVQVMVAFVIALLYHKYEEKKIVLP